MKTCTPNGLPIMKLMLDCRALARLLSQSQDEAPARVTRARMRLHLVTCEACRNVDEQMRFVGKAMQELQLKPSRELPVVDRPQ
jgi:predicted anti-sigma-YlaC factor YlaD